MIILTAAALAMMPGMAMGATTTATAAPRAVVEEMLATINRHDAKALAALYADDAVSISSDSCKPVIGPEPVRQNHETLLASMPDLRVAATDWVVDGDHVAILFTAYSKALGPSGEMRFADFLTVKAGKIVRDVTMFNPGEPCH